MKIASHSRRARGLALLLALTSATAAHAASKADKQAFADAHAQWQAQARTPETDAYLDAWAAFNNAHKLDERDGCYFKARPALVQILVIDATGTVVGYAADRDNGRSRCWRQTYMGVTFPKPPFAPFYHRLEMGKVVYAPRTP